MTRQYRISLKPRLEPLRDPRGAKERALVGLQHRLNAKFITRRDSGQNIEPIYTHLKIVERRLSAARIFW